MESIELVGLGTDILDFTGGKIMKIAVADGAPEVETPVWRIMMIAVDVIVAAAIVLIMARAVAVYRKEKVRGI